VKIAVLNGPNLNLLGVREPAIYGRDTLADVEKRVRVVAKELGVQVEFVQKNGEGELVDCIQALRGRVDGAVAILSGFGTMGYELALRGLVAALADRG
jgi:3-dehydroquinate dehydratase-2